MRVVALPALLCLAGCTHLQTTVADHTGGRLVGVPYALPTLYHDLTITREIVGCDGAVDAQTPKILIEVEAKAGYGRGEVFVIDPTQMKSWTKTTALKLEFYANGTIKSINAAAVDHGPEIVAGLVKAGFSIARLASGVPAAGGGGGAAMVTGAAKPPPEPQFQCPKADLDTIATDAKGLKGLAAHLDDLGRQLDPLRTAAAIGGLSEDDKKRLVKIQMDIRDTNSSVAKVQDDRDLHRKRLIIVETLRLTPDSDHLDRVVPFPSADADVAAAEAQWLRPFYPAPAAGARQPAETRDALDQRLTLSAIYAPEEEHATGAMLAKGELALPGFAYRLPIKATLRICGGVNARKCRMQLADDDLLDATDSAPQLGRLVILPLKNGFGEDTELTAEFTESGELSSAHYDSRKVAVEQALGAINGGLGAAETFVAAKKKADQAAADAAAAKPGKDLDAQIALLTKQKQLLDAQAAIKPDNLAEAQAQTDLNVQLAQLTAQKAILDIQAQINKEKHP